MKTPGEMMTAVYLGFACPITMILNFSLFQYLVTTFWARRRERRVRLLLFVALLSYISLIPFALDNRRISEDLTGISEVCTMLTFLMQITILTRDVSKRIKIRSVQMLMWCGEMLVIISVCLLVINVVHLIAPVVSQELVAVVDDVLEHISLVFIVCFRFYFLSMAKGFRKVLATQKKEIVFYLLFLTHEVPFHVLEHYTGLDWHHIQGLWKRITIALCLSSTIRARLSSMHSMVLTSLHDGLAQKNPTIQDKPKRVDGVPGPISAAGSSRKSSAMRSAATVGPMVPQ